MVTLVLDKELMASPRLGVHPLINTQTVAISPAELTSFVTHYNHAPILADFGGAVSAPGEPKPPKPDKPKAPAKPPPAKGEGKKENADALSLIHI